MIWQVDCFIWPGLMKGLVLVLTISTSSEANAIEDSKDKHLQQHRRVTPENISKKYSNWRNQLKILGILENHQQLQNCNFEEKNLQKKYKKIFESNFPSKGAFTTIAPYILYMSKPKYLIT